MPLTERDGQKALREHLMEKARLARARYEHLPASDRIQAWLGDCEVVRYPTEIVFSESGLEPGLFACPEPRAERAHDGFTLVVHPRYKEHPELPLLIAYHLPSINYGEIVTATDAESFGAELSGLDLDEYYQRVCACADEC